MTRRRVISLLIGLAICFGSVTSVNADAVTDWNAIASDTLLLDTTIQNPGMASRNMAMVNLAMYDAVNGVNPTHQQFYSHSAAPSNASASAAAIQAAYRVLSLSYPGQSSFLDTQRTNALSAIPNSAAKDAGINYGNLVGTNIVNNRVNDGYDSMVNYSPQTGAGHWEPDPMNPGQEAWGPAWGTLQPFGISSAAAHMPPSMPELTSQAYTDAFNEVKSLGEKNSTARTADQTEAAVFWAYDRLGMGTPMRMYNGILRTVAESQNSTLNDNARVFAISATAMADAGIVAWDSKFEYDFWRPISGIRRADEDGNPDTIADPDWEPLAAPGGIGPDGSVIPDFTPPFPTYVSGHASFGGALFESMTNFYGTDSMDFSVTSDELPGVVRDFTSFSQANEENGRSRVYLGIHWDFDDFIARDLGGEVADYLYDNHFQPVPEPSSGVLLVLGLTFLGLRRR